MGADIESELLDLQDDVSRIVAREGGRPVREALNEVSSILHRLKKSIDAVESGPRRRELAGLWERASERLDEAKAELLSRKQSALGERPSAIGGTVWDAPADREAHRRVGRTQSYEDET